MDETVHSHKYGMREFINNMESTPLAFREEARGFHHGQQDLTLVALRNGEQVGYIDYAVYQGEVSVNYMKVSDQNRRQGIGTAMVRELQRLYPDTEIDFGMATEDGAKLIDSLPTHIFPNGRMPTLQRRLERVREMIDDCQEEFERTGVAPEHWNRLYNIERKLEMLLRGKPLFKTLIRLDEKKKRRKGRTPTIATATEKGGQINRKTANRIVDPHGYFHPRSYYGESAGWSSRRDKLSRLHDLVGKLKKLALVALERHRKREERSHSVLPNLAMKAMQGRHDADRRAYDRAKEHHRRVSDLHDKLTQVLARSRRG